MILEWDSIGLELVLCVQEEQSGSGSANYDVELIHLSEAHRDILRGGTCTCTLCYITICCMGVEYVHTVLYHHTLHGRGVCAHCTCYIDAAWVWSMCALCYIDAAWV